MEDQRGNMTIKNLERELAAISLDLRHWEDLHAKLNKEAWDAGAAAAYCAQERNEIVTALQKRYAEVEQLKTEGGPKSP